MNIGDRLSPLIDDACTRLERAIGRLADALDRAVAAVLLAPYLYALAWVQIVRDADHPLDPPVTPRPAELGALRRARARRHPEGDTPPWL